MNREDSFQSHLVLLFLYKGQAGGCSSHPDPGDSGSPRSDFTLLMVALASVRQKLQHAATELEEDLVDDTVLATEELDIPASMQLGHALSLVASSYSMVSQKTGGLCLSHKATIMS